MSGFSSRGYKILALVPKCNLPSEDEGNSDEEEDDNIQVSERVESYFQYLENDFQEVYQGITYDHGVELFSTAVNPTPIENTPNDEIAAEIQNYEVLLDSLQLACRSNNDVHSQLNESHPPALFPPLPYEENSVPEEIHGRQLFSSPQKMESCANDEESGPSEIPAPKAIPKHALRFEDNDEQVAPMIIDTTLSITVENPINEEKKIQTSINCAFYQEMDCASFEVYEESASSCESRDDPNRRDAAHTEFQGLPSPGQPDDQKKIKHQRLSGENNTSIPSISKTLDHRKKPESPQENDTSIASTSMNISLQTPTITNENKRKGYTRKQWKKDAISKKASTKQNRKQWKKGTVPKKTTSKQKAALKKKKSNVMAPEYEWHRGVPFRHEVSQPPYVPPDNNQQILEPLEYFLQMFSSDMIEHIVYQSNLYSTQEKNANRMTNHNTLVLDKDDIYDFLAVEILTGVVSFPSAYDPWSENLRFDKVASIMSRNKYKQTKQILHFNDNSQLPSNDPYFKVRPLLDMVRRNFHGIPEEPKYSIDEMMIPYKGTRAGSKRQYMKDKPVRWGLKLFVRSGVSGMTYDFFLYCGESTFDSADFTEHEKQFGVSSLAVLALIKSIPEPSLKFIFFDNYYSNPRLMSYLREEYGILSLGTIRTNRFPGLDFKEDKEMGKTGKGTFDVLVDNKKKLVAVKWLDNKAVHVVSTFCGAGEIKEVKRWSKKEKKYVSVKCPQIIQIYNEFMGGVDLSGQLVSFYRTQKKKPKMVHERI